MKPANTSPVNGDEYDANFITDNRRRQFEDKKQ